MKMTKMAVGPYEVARRCHVMPGTVYRWIKSGKLSAFKTAGGHHRVWEADLDPFLRDLNIPSLTENSNGRKKVVIIVDDELPVRRLLTRIVRRALPQAEIQEAVDGYEAGYKTRDLKPDLVVLDLLLPGIDGFKICRRIKRDKNLKGVKVIAITAYRPEKSRKVILKAGADAFFSKPFNSEELTASLKELIGARK